jgi:hypothetical protein
MQALQKLIISFIASLSLCFQAASQVTLVTVGTNSVLVYPPNFIAANSLVTTGWISTNAVSSVAGKKGDVALTSADVGGLDSSLSNRLRFDTAQSITASQAVQGIENLRRVEVDFLLIRGIINAGIATVARTSNVATVTTTAPHRMIVGQRVAVNATTDNTFDALWSAAATVVAIPSGNSFTYSSAGSDTAQKSESGSLTTWNVVDDGGHGPTRNARLSSISASAVTVEWDALPSGTWKIASATIGNHQNNASGRYSPHFGGVGTTTATIQLRFRNTVFGRAYWNGTTSGGGITANANWIKEGDTASAGFVGSGIEAFFIGHSANALPTSGSRGASSWPLPVLQSPHPGVSVRLPNFQISPFTAAGYQPTATGFYGQFYDASGNLMNQAAVEAITPASRVQITWSRTVDVIEPDHTLPTEAVTLFARIVYHRTD